MNQNLIAFLLIVGLLHESTVCVVLNLNRAFFVQGWLSIGMDSTASAASLTVQGWLSIGMDSTAPATSLTTPGQRKKSSLSLHSFCQSRHSCNLVMAKVSGNTLQWTLPQRHFNATRFFNSLYLVDLKWSLPLLDLIYRTLKEKIYIKYAYYFSDDSSCYGVSARPEHQPSQLLILCIQLQAHWPQHLNSDHSHRVLSNAPTDTKNTGWLANTSRCYCC